MAFQKLQFKPGIVDEVTNYTNTGGWYDCDKIRFRNGFPEKIGGWIKYESSADFVGTVRAIYPYASLSGASYLAVGTSKKYYIDTNGTAYDITPIRKTTNPMGNNPFTTGAAGSKVVTVTDNSHNAITGDYVTFSGVTGPIDGIPASEFNKEHTLTYVSGNTYTITVDTGCTAGSISGGGAVAIAEYQISISRDVNITSSGYGSGSWGESSWGGSASLSSPTTTRTWSQSTFGEDLIFNPRAGGVFYMDRDDIGSARAEWIKDMPGETSAPEAALYTLVSDQRHVVCCGANDIGESAIDPLLVRWSSKDSAIIWYPQITNSAGSFYLSNGSAIISAKETTREILIWTDTALYSMQYVGAPYTYSFNLISSDISITGPNSVVVVDDLVFWMGIGRFFIYDGRVNELPCSVKRYVFSDFSNAQMFQVCAGVIKQYSEVVWFYRSDAIPSDPNVVLPDKYVVYNYADKLWYYGTIERTAWCDAVYPFNYPMGGSVSSVYYHEYGLDDVSDPDNPQAIEAYIASSDIEIGDGEKFAFITKLLPDVTFIGSTATSPTADITLSVRRSPGSAYHEDSESNVVRSTTVPVEQFTEQAWVRLRGRAMKFKISSDTLGVNWQLGSPRIDWQPDGKR